MTGFSWNTASSPRAMLSLLRGCRTQDERKLTMFAAHCCRRVWHLLTDERSRAAVEVVEQFVDGAVSPDALGLARQDAVTALRGAMEARNQDPSLPEMFTLAARMASFTVGAPGSDAPGVAEGVVAAGSLITRNPASGLDREAELAAWCDIMRDLFGDPMQPVAFDPNWRTEAVVSLSRGIYSGAWVRMSVLADALEDAGADLSVVQHCREQGVHVKGCHIIDAILNLV